jgi:hypothetical protein
MSFKTLTPILSKDETKKFLDQIDLACRLLNAQVLKWVLVKFNLHELKDSPEFLEDAKDKLEFWKTSGSSVVIKEVGSFDTTCIACVFGKKVYGYIVTYIEENKNGVKVKYEREFAVNYHIKDGRLTDFGWCHAFLNKLEMGEVLNEDR